MKGVGKRMPVRLWCYPFFALALIGIPPASGFVSKWYLAQGALQSGTGIFELVGPVVLLVSALLTAGYLLTITMQGFFPGEEKELTAKKEPHLFMLLPLVVLAFLALVLGLFPSVFIASAEKIAALVF